MRRRHFLTLSATSVGGALVYTLDRRPLRVHAQEKSLKIPLRFFTREEALGKISHDLLRTEFPEPLPGIMEILLRNGVVTVNEVRRARGLAEII